jgi:hypothetical protein
MHGGTKSAIQLDPADCAMVVGWQLPTDWHSQIPIKTPIPVRLRCSRPVLEALAKR